MDKKTGPTGFKAWLIVLIALLDDIAALALVFLVLLVLDVQISLPVMIIVGLALGTIIFFIHRAVVPSLKLRKVSGAEGMIGAIGKVTEPLNPVGTIMINGEYWKAACPGEKIDTGRNVEVVGIKGLNLEVKEKES